SSVTKILHDKEKWLDVSSTSHHNTFHHRKVRFPELEKAMNIWIGQVSASGLIITDNLVAEKAKNFGEKLGIEKTELTFSNGWLRGFKQRNNLKAVKIHGEANNETGLFYYMSPNQTLASAWMRTDIFEKWLRDLDTVFRVENRNILLLIDNAPSHTDPGSLLDEQLKNQISAQSNDFRLTNIKIHFLPPNTTAHLQPMDAGIINNYKVNYKQLYVHNLIKKFELRQNLEKTIVNCWNKTEILSTTNEETTNKAVNNQMIEEQNNRNKLYEIIEMILNEVNEVNDESGEDTDEPEAIVCDNDALGAINKLLIYIEQQNDSEFDENDYKNLKKYKQKIERRIFFQKHKKKLE
ncbi:4831_t:CDS:2, partial [Entrophospora sp. SA101]